MRTKSVALVLLVAFAALALLAGTAAATPGPTGPQGPYPTATTHAATLAYPWVHPVWSTVHGIVVVTLPSPIETVNTQPPAWVLSS